MLNFEFINVATKWQLQLWQKCRYFIRIFRIYHILKTPDTLDQTSLGSRLIFILCLHKSHKSSKDFSDLYFSFALRSILKSYFFYNLKIFKTVTLYCLSCTFINRYPLSPILIYLIKRVFWGYLKVKVNVSYPLIM